jgi:hypothetical protein
MTQLHCIHKGLDVVRPTNDVDIVLHVETTRGVAATAATALESLGYELAPSTDPRVESAPLGMSPVCESPLRTLSAVPLTLMRWT